MFSKRWSISVIKDTRLVACVLTVIGRRNFSYLRTWHVYLTFFFRKPPIILLCNYNTKWQHHDTASPASNLHLHLINYQQTSIVICNGFSNLHDNVLPNYRFVHYVKTVITWLRSLLTEIFYMINNYMAIKVVWRLLQSSEARGIISYVLWCVFF